MRKPTAEQKAAAEERRAKMRAIAKTIAAMTEPQRLELAARCSIRTIEGRTLRTDRRNLARARHGTDLSQFAASRPS